MPKKEMKTGKCNCRPGIWLVALVVGTLGVFALVEGFSTQLTNGLNSWPSVLPWYFFGLLLAGVAKFLKRHSHAPCPVHGSW